MWIVDAHLDLAWNALQSGRDLTRPVSEIRETEPEVTVALPEMRQGRVALCFATILARSTGVPEPGLDYASPVQAHAAAQGHLAYYHALAQEGYVRLITDAAGLARHVAEWDVAESTPGALPPVGLVASMEGADPILAPDRLEDWWDGGVRIIGLAHYGPGRYAGGTGTPLGLTDLGLGLLAEMERLGVILDLTHLSEPAFWQALERYGGRVLASHNNCRALVPHPRQFSDEQLRAIFERDGVIGAVLDAWMLQPGWVRGESSNAQLTLDAVVDQIDHICQLAGHSRCAALGSDLDGGFGRAQTACDLDTIADLQKIAPLLAARGYGEADITAIMRGNWLRLLRESWR